MTDKRKSLSLSFSCFGMDRRKMRRKSISFSADSKELHQDAANVSISAEEVRELERCLSQLPVFSTLRPSARLALYHRMEIREYCKGENIVKRGELMSEIGVVLHGNAESDAARDVKCWGELCTVHPAEAETTIVAAGRCRGAVISGSIVRNTARTSRQHDEAIILQSIQAIPECSKLLTQSDIVDMFSYGVYGAGDSLPNKHIHIILEGTVKVDSENRFAGQVINLMDNNDRKCPVTVVIQGTVEVASLKQDDILQT